MTKSELIKSLYKKLPHLAYTDVEMAVKTIIESMTDALGI